MGYFEIAIWQFLCAFGIESFGRALGYRIRKLAGYFSRGPFDIRRTTFSPMMPPKNVAKGMLIFDRYSVL
jgi:hypothetical protein